MNLIDKIKQQFKKSNKNSMYVMSYDEYTNAKMYFEVDLETKTCKIIDKLPKDAVVTDYDDIDIPIYKRAVDKAISEYLFDSFQNEINLSKLLYLEKMDTDSKVKETYDAYLKLMEVLEAKCKRHNIQTTSDENIIFSKILNIINEYSNKRFQKHVIGNYEPVDVIKFSFSEELIAKEVEKEINGATFNSRNFLFEKQYISNYFLSFIDNYRILFEILNKKVITDDEKKVIANYLELFKVLPRLIQTMDLLQESADKVDTAKDNYRTNKYNKNISFLNEITNLLSRTDSEKEDIYLHATTSGDAAKSIMDRGLYTYGDIDSFSMPYVNIEQILKYAYRSELNLYSDYIIVFRLPKGTIEPEKISEEEANEAMKHIDMRRNIMVPPSGKIGLDNILGVIDKKNMRVIPNDKFKILDDNKKSLMS